MSDGSAPVGTEQPVGPPKTNFASGSVARISHSNSRTTAFIGRCLGLPLLVRFTQITSRWKSTRREG